MNTAWATIVEVWESYFILSPDLVSHNNFVNVVKFIPVFVVFELIAVEWFEFGTARDRQVQCFCGIEAVFVKQIKVVFVG